MKAIFRRVLARRCTVTLAVLSAVLFAYLFGYITGINHLFPHRYLAKLDKIAGAVIQQRALNAQTIESKSIPTIFVNLRIDEIEDPVPTEFEGGGLTSFRDELLLITYDGVIFLILHDEIERARIQSPDNGRREYIAASESDKYRGLEHQTWKFRYNDILYYEEDGEHGLVISYSEWHPDEECYGTTLAQLDVPSEIESIGDFEAAGDDWRIVYRTQPCLKLKSKWRAVEGHMAGGRIAYLQPHKVLLGSGDYGWDGIYAPDAYAQEVDNDYGKVLEIDLNSGASRTVSFGHRNLQGVHVHQNGQIWVTEHGPRGGDELNRVIEGGNFGWPEEVLGTRYNGLPSPGAGQYGRHDLHIAPTYAWVPSIAVSGLTQIRGFDPSWDGDLLVSSLKGKKLFRLRIKENRVIFAEPIEIGQRIRYIHQHTDGRIALWTDRFKIAFLSHSTETNTQLRIEKLIANSDYDAHQKERLISAIDGCSECHSFETNAHVGAPGLGAIFDSRIASTGYSQYSDALRSTPGIWTDERLSHYLQNPQGFAPGTTMPDPGIDDQFVIDGIVEILDRIKNDAE